MRALAVAVGLAALLAGCGDSGTVGSKSQPPLVVSAASSMKEALTACAPDFTGAQVRLQFAGSDELAAQIRQGVPVDVFASANTKLPAALASEGKLDAPVMFASNQLVLAIPARESSVANFGDLQKQGTTLVIGAAGVPVGDYTRKVLKQLGPQQNKAILANVKSNEPDVKGVVGKLTQGAADAGFVYASDVKATNGRLKAITIPPELGSKATYGAGVVKASKHAAEARAFVDDLKSGGCHHALIAAGFGEP